jgi:Flp pilus assembly pilin Flp
MKVISKLGKFWKDEEGLGTLEILLIVAVLVGVALLFRTQIIEWVQKLLQKSGTEIDQF